MKSTLSCLKLLLDRNSSFKGQFLSDPKHPDCAFAAALSYKMSLEVFAEMQNTYKCLNCIDPDGLKTKAAIAEARMNALFVIDAHHHSVPDRNNAQEILLALQTIYDSSQNR